MLKNTLRFLRNAALVGVCAWGIYGIVQHDPWCKLCPWIGCPICDP